jgi:hypothetical protein
MKPRSTIITNIKINLVGTLAAEFPNNNAEPGDSFGSKPAWTVFVRTCRQTLLISLCFLLCSPIQVLAQTVIAVARNTEEVVLAADSKGVDIRSSTPTLLCKIRPVGEFWVAVSGHFNSKAGSAPRIDVWASLDQAVKSGGNQHDKVENFVSIFRPQIEGLIKEMMIWDRATYDKINVITSVIFVAVNKGVPVFFERDFIKNISKSSLHDPVNILREDMADALVDNQIQLNCRGACSNCGSCDAMEFIEKNAVTGFALKPVDLAHFMVAYGALTSPKVVGPPIEVLRMSKDGIAKWIQRETCKNTSGPEEPRKKPTNGKPEPPKVSQEKN